MVGVVGGLVEGQRAVGGDAPGAHTCVRARDVARACGRLCKWGDRCYSVQEVAGAVALVPGRGCACSCSYSRAGYTWTSGGRALALCSR